MNENQIKHPYLFSLLLIVVVVVFGAISAMLELPWLLLVPAVGLVAWSDSRRLLVTFEFSAVFLVLLTVLVVVGTLYPKAAMWHSYWFMGLLALLGLSSLLCVVLKYNKRRGVSYVIIHLSVVVVLVGSFIKFMLKEEGFIHIREGMETREMFKMKGGVTTEETAQLPFTVRLNKFDVEFYDSKPQVFIFENMQDRPSAVLAMEGKTQVELAGVSVKLLGFREHPFAPSADFPPVQVKMAEMEVDGKRGFVTEGRPVRHNKLAFVYRESRGEAKVYRSDLSLLDDQGKELARQSVVVNDPIYLDGWWLYQSNWDPRDLSYSGIHAVKDPGLWVVFAGLILLSIGAILKVRFKKSGDEGGAA